jgi:hypothetical protein
MATLNFGKVKLVHRGEYSGITTYSAGDIVSFGLTAPSTVGAFQHPNPVFVYKNKASKVGSHPYLQTVSGTVTSLGISTNIVTLTVSSQNNVGGDHNGYAVPKLSRVYSKYVSGNTKVLEKTTLSATQVQLKLSKYTTNTSVISNDPFVVGARRYANRYDIEVNTTDWDIYSDTFIFRGDWNPDQSYLPGNIVVRNNQSYVCKTPTGIGSTYLGLGSNNLGPCTTTKAIDPQWDYFDVWDNYINRDCALQKEKKILLLPNNNPVQWKGHPFIPAPRWGQSGIGSFYQGGYPWTLQAGMSTSPHTWMWTTHKYLHQEASRISFITGDGRQVIGGASTESLDPSANVGGLGGVNGSGFIAEGDSFMLNEYVESRGNAAGNLPFEKSRSSVFPIQYVPTVTTRAYLFSNGTVGISGRAQAGVRGTGYVLSNTTNMVLELGKDSFGGKSIVKIDLHNDYRGDGEGQQHIAALDEYGELWVWGDNSYLQLGIGSDFGDSSSLGVEYDNGANIDSTFPICLDKDDRFEGRRIVDFHVCSRAMYALDEDGELWSWGDNTSGGLGYPTNDTTKFRSTVARSPHRLSDSGILGFTWTGAALGGLVGAGYTNITQVTSGVSYTKTSGGVGWNAEVYSTVGYSSTVAISARAGQINNGLMFGLQRAPGNGASWTGVNAGWYFVDADDYVQYVQNDNNADLNGGGSSGRYQYTPATVLSIVYEPISNCVHWYYDYQGDGRCVQLVRRLQKNATNFTGVTSTTAWYFDSSFYRNDTNLNSIGISSSVTAKTWSSYGGIQKFLVNKGSITGENNLFVLDGQGHFWSCGFSDNGQIGDGWNNITDNTTSSLQRRQFTGIGSALPGRINNIWTAGSYSRQTFISCRDINNSNVNYIYGFGDNVNYVLTDGTTTDRYSPVLINGPTSRGTLGGTSVGIGTSLVNIVNIFSGGSGPNATSNKELIWGLDAAGYLYATGLEKDGASGAINVITADIVVSNNNSKVQQYDSNRFGWARVFTPTGHQGKIIDLACSGCQNTTGGTRGTDAQTMYYLTEDAQGAWCGTNNQIIPASTLGLSVRAPYGLPGFI